MSTSASSAIIEKILKSPDAVMVSNSLKSRLEEERKKRIEFYNWIDEDKKAEFINGEIVIHSPVKKEHWQISDLLSRLLSVFASVFKLGKVGSEKVMIALTRNDYEPDLVFFPKEMADKFKKDQVLFPAPSFVVEILSPSTASKDRNVKKEDYALHGIQEYWIIDPKKQRIEQYLLLGNSIKYTPAKVFQYGEEIESAAVKGFRISTAAIFDEEENLKAMKELLG